MDFALYQIVTGSDDASVILYVIIGVIVLCSSLIFAVELIYYQRSKRRLIQFLQNPDMTAQDVNIHLLF